MKTVRILSTTHWMGPDGQSMQKLPEGFALEVEDDTAKRWIRNRIAEEWDGPVGQVDEAYKDATVDELDAQIKQLEALKAQRANQAPVGLPEEPSYDDGLAGYDYLTEQQRTNLRRAGFTDATRIANAPDSDLLQVEGVGQATIDKLRAT